MKALVKKHREKGLWLDDIPMPAIGDSDVLIRILGTAICGTDVHIYQWDDWAQRTVPVPMAIGHEFMGEVAELGQAVTGLKIGERVSGEGHIVCGQCRNCRAGHRHLCEHTVGIGVHRGGCFAEFLSLPASNVFPIPEGVGEPEAIVLDPFGNAVHTALSFDLVGEDVLITGAGPIGLIAGAVAKHAGARHVVITDVNEYRLNLAKAMGIETAINPSTITLTDVMKRLGMTEGFDVGLEMSGSPAALNSMLDSVRHGAKIALLGILPADMRIPWDHVIFKGLTIKGIYGREIFETWYKMCAMIQSGLNVKPVFTHRFPADRFEEGFAAMISGECGKVVLDWR